MARKIMSGLRPWPPCHTAAAAGEYDVYTLAALMIVRRRYYEALGELPTVQRVTPLRHVLPVEPVNTLGGLSSIAAVHYYNHSLLRRQRGRIAIIGFPRRYGATPTGGQPLGASPNYDGNVWKVNLNAKTRRSRDASGE